MLAPKVIEFPAIEMVEMLIGGVRMETGRPLLTESLARF